MLNVVNEPFMLSVFMLNVIMLNVIMMSVLAPCVGRVTINLVKFFVKNICISMLPLCTLLALATLGHSTQVGPLLFVLNHPTWSWQERAEL
jgi:hypothetical protein